MLTQSESHSKGPALPLLVDSMLGRLARWLRLLGYDAAYWHRGSDLELIKQAEAEGRLIVTRDRQLAGRRGVEAILVCSETLNEQLAEVRLALGRAPEPLSRCPECNSLLDVLPREAARDLVPPYVWQTQPAFSQCPICRRVFWRGTHWVGIRARLA